MRTHQQLELASEVEAEERVRRVELLISNLLRFGVTLSLTLIVVGTVISFVGHPEYLSDGTSFRRFIEPNGAVPHTLRQVAAAVRTFSGQSIVTLGILLLIATPVIRVGVSIFTFIYQRDRLYTAITTIVFCLLLLSFVLGKVE